MRYFVLKLDYLISFEDIVSFFFSPTAIGSLTLEVLLQQGERHIEQSNLVNVMGTSHSTELSPNFLARLDIHVQSFPISNIQSLS